MVTNRRVITARTSVFRQTGEIGQDIPIDRVRYVRVRVGQDGNVRSTIDLITSDENISWRFPAGTDDAHIEALAAVLADSMMIPDSERDELALGGSPLIAVSEDDTSASSLPAELPQSDVEILVYLCALLSLELLDPSAAWPGLRKAVKLEGDRTIYINRKHADIRARAHEVEAWQKAGLGTVRPDDGTYLRVMYDGSEPAI